MAEGGVDRGEVSEYEKCGGIWGVQDVDGVYGGGEEIELVVSVVWLRWTYVAFGTNTLRITWQCITSVIDVKYDPRDSSFNHRTPPAYHRYPNREIWYKFEEKR